MRYLFGFICVLALGVMGCGETTGDPGGSGGSAGMGGGGAGGDGGTGGMPSICIGPEDCDDNDACTKEVCEELTMLMCSYVPVDCDDRSDCTTETCDAADGCTIPTPIPDGTQCAGGTCQSGACQLAGSVLPCTEQGINNAIAAGGGPYTFDCDGTEPVVTQATIIIDNDVTLDGEGNLTVDGNDDHRVFSVPAGVTAELHGLSIRRGSALGAGFEAQIGGGILNSGTLTLINSTVSGNAAGLGGGIENRDPATLTLTNSTVSGNAGGGIRNWATLTMTNSTVSGNNTYGILNVATLTLTNSTVSGNAGGGILNVGTLTMMNSTVSGNAGGGILMDSRNGEATLARSLVDGDCVGDIVSNGHNIESPGNTCGFDQEGDQADVNADDLKLGPLQDNGGPTMTHALGAGSVAIDHIPAVDCVDADGQPLTTDQRGQPRPETGGTMCDVGAFEVQP